MTGSKAVGDYHQECQSMHNQTPHHKDTTVYKSILYPTPNDQLFTSFSNPICVVCGFNVKKCGLGKHHRIVMATCKKKSSYMYSCTVQPKIIA
eukprot:4514621-Amphidinium_carterae.1